MREKGGVSVSEISRQTIEEITREEIKGLKREGLISEEDYDYLWEVYSEYAKSQIVPAVEEAPVAEKAEEKSSEVVSDPIPPVKKEPKKKKELTAEQVRERNITWSLILGVSFLLIGGLVVATSTWEQLGPGMKVVAISFVSIFFLALSGITSKLLKIEKTAFAFLTLGSLMIPIAVIAIGYFQLFGPYLSLTGDGRYLLGLIGTLVPLPLYVRNAIKHESRLFVWISYLFLSFTVGFGMAAIDVPLDAFYLCIMLFNGILLYGYHRFQANKDFAIFIKELPAYSQLNLIVSTLLMLVIFDQELFYGFNILLTAAIYMAMVFVYNTKEYQFVFSAMFAYGAYQIVEHSFLNSIDLVVYALVGFAYMGFAYTTKSHTFIPRTFRYISAAVSLLAFIYVSYQGILLRAGEDSFLLLLAYLVIAVNYTYLAYLTNHTVFQYLAPFFTLVMGFQLWEVLDSTFNWNNPAMFMFIYSMVLFLLLGIWNKNNYLLPIKKSSFYMTIAVMMISIGYGIYITAYVKVSLMLGLFGVLAYIVAKKGERKEEKLTAAWVHAISWLLALVTIYPELFSQIPAYSTNFNGPFHFCAAGLLLLGISVGWQKVKERALALSAFYIGQGAYLCGLLLLINVVAPIDENVVRPLLLFVGIGVFVWLVRRTTYHSIWLLVAVISFAFYGSLLSPLSFTTLEATVIYLLFAPIFLLLVDALVGKRVKELKPYYFWLAHSIQLILIPVIMLDQAFTPTINPMFLFIPLLVYVYSANVSQVEWAIKGFLYAAMTMIPLLITTIIPYYGLFETIPDPYYWLASSLVMTLGWLFVKQEWRTRMEWYLIPFSNYGLLTLISERGTFLLVELLPILGYVLLNLYFLHKRRWYMGTIIPLVSTIFMWEQERYLLESGELLLISFASFFVLVTAGRYLYSEFYKWEKGTYYFDWYAITAVFYLMYSSTFISIADSVWIKILPFLLLTLWLFVQVFRFKLVLVQQIIKTVGVISILPSYYLILDAYEEWIPELFKAEVAVLPLLGIVIGLSLKTWSSYKKVMNHTQLVVLLLVTAYLVADAIQSHTIWDALIIGGLSLVSMLVGMQYRIKSYFFVGIGVLIFNVIYQTKPYWGNMPWWVYLLIAGFALIGIASYNELQKQKTDGKKGKIEKKLKELYLRFKEWD